MPEAAKFTHGGSLARNTLFNLIGYGVPLLVSVLAIPLLVRGLGTDRFGVLAIAWMVIGYFSLFDLGLGRALTQLVATRLGTRKQDEISGLVWTTFLLMAGLGSLGALLLVPLSPWLVRSALNIPEPLHDEAISAFRLLALSLPCVISTIGFRGVLEALQRFDLVNAVRIPLGVLTFVGPLAVLPFSSSLVPVVAVLVIGRLVAWIIHLALCFRVIPRLRERIILRREVAGRLLRFGTWMTVSNVISPLMVYLDRFLIGAVLSMTAVAYYVAPYEIVTRIWLLPGAFLGVLFPAFAMSFACDRAQTARLVEHGLKGVAVVVFPIVLVAVALASEGLGLWLGADFVRSSTRVLQWLAVGVFINSLGQVAFSVIQGIGRPDLTGKLHLVELPVYLVAIWWLLGRYGIEGAAAAWTFRVAIDTVILFVIAGRFLPESLPTLRGTLLCMGIALLVLVFAAVLQGVGVKLVYLTTVLIAFGLIGWYRVLAPGERTWIRLVLASRGGGGVSGAGSSA